MFVKGDEVELRNGNPTIKIKEGAYMRRSILELYISLLPDLKVHET